jgi:Domain of unknown function (DUF4424)
MMRRIIAALLLGFCSTQAFANDGYAEIGLGGLVLKDTDKISMDKEDLYVSPTEIRVEYEFSNLTDKDIEATVMFPLPDLVLLDEYNSARGLVSFEKHLKFKTEVDGKAFPIALEQKAFAKGKDITADVLKAGLAVSGDMEDFSKFVRGLTPDMRRNLIDVGAIDKYVDDAGNELPYPDDFYIEPQWIVKSNMVRKQLFPAGKILKVKHSYVPVVGASVSTYFPSKSDIAQMDADVRADLEKDQARFCYDDGFWKSFEKRVKKEKGNVGQPTIISYILTSGATWEGPIKDFRLVVDKAKPDALVSFCGEGVKKIAPTQFEVRKTNFEPSRDLDVMIVNWAK